jgi:chromosome segregation protein
MVFVKRIELSRFKSFGGSNSIPFLPGFTVVSGPNGSGKSNILDALLFCLGLASSKGMRAERLPDLINNSQNSNGKIMETVVSVIFDLDNLESLNNDLILENTNPNHEINREENNLEENIKLESLSELKVTRRLRVTKGGSYASTFYLNDNPCNASELHTQLNRLRIYPEGYNVVLQGDVTRIITMNAKERREIIDELAGVAEFDRKIEQTKTTLEAVKEREEKCQIIQDELIQNSAKLKQDSEKAIKYQKLKAQIQEKKQWEFVINWRYLKQQTKEIEEQLIDLESQQKKNHDLLSKIQCQITESKVELGNLNQEVKALGEEEQIKIASRLATQKAKQQQLKQRIEDLVKSAMEVDFKQEEITTKIKEYEQQLQSLSIKIDQLQNEKIPQLESNKNFIKSELNNYKEQAQLIASQSQAWVAQQTELNHEISVIQKELNPLLTQKALLTERCQKLQSTIKSENEQLTELNENTNSKVGQIPLLTAENRDSEANIQTLAENLAKIEAEISLNQDTINRLQVEQREKQRQLDKLEATKQAQQEAQGTYASKIILNSDLPGVCGLVAQLGEVDSAYQLALEISAGSRLGFIVVEDDTIAAMGIKLLKQQKAGRATFLPLNKIRSSLFNIPREISQARGFVDLAVNLVKFEPQYQGIFTYVFGNTVIFEDLDSARRLMGQGRIVTLDGELLEPSGAMTGGSVSSRSSLKFGRVSSTENQEFFQLGDRASAPLRDRIKEIEDTIIHLSLKISEKRQFVKQWSEELNQERQKRQKRQLILEQCQQEISRLEKEKKIIESNANNYQDLVKGKQELNNIEQNLPLLQAKLTTKQEELKNLESSYDNQEWQNLQQIISQQELLLEERQSALNESQQNLQQLINQNEDLQIKIKEGEENINDLLAQKNQVKEEKVKLTDELTIIEEDINKYENLFQELAQKLETIKEERNKQENLVKKLESEQQQLQWALEKIVLQHQESQTKLNELTLQIEEVSQDLPNPLPEIPWLVNNSETGENNNKITFDSLQDQLEQIKQEIRKGEKKLEALEPVNMLALEQYEKNQERLEELSEKLTTLAGERTELLLRVENFTTLRLRAFKESFTAVNENFKNIFATLSEGDGYLKLEDENNPFNGGLTLVAHPKGKPVLRLSSMSGGEKSLTALSFIFALQRYRPSPFYAFDEVDMFLDGANVEKLSKMIQQQAKSAQFIVVSLRRPMIEASQRTIGVTQAKGAYTQVLGIKLS